MIPRASGSTGAASATDEVACFLNAAKNASGDIAYALVRNNAVTPAALAASLAPVSSDENGAAPDTERHRNSSPSGVLMISHNVTVFAPASVARRA